MEPLAEPQALGLVEFADKIGGVPPAFTVTEPTTLQDTASVTVTVKLPAESPEMVAVVPPLLQRYVYGEVPPEGVAVAVPLPCPQSSSVAETETVGAPVEVRVTDKVSIHPLASVAVKIYIPPTRALRS